MSNRLYLDEVRRFERCEYALEEFRHSEHLKVAWTDLQLYGYEAAVSRMRAGLQRFSAHHKQEWLQRNHYGVLDAQAAATIRFGST